MARSREGERRDRRPGLCVVVLLSLIAGSCGGDGDETPPGENDVWDIDVDGIPAFVEDDFIEVEKIQRISRFRSGEGHDYSDAFESCRSMKHYFVPKANLDWSTVVIRSPVEGKITRAEQEWAGTKYEIQSHDHPAFRFVIFHVAPSALLVPGERVAAGQVLGQHIGQQTYSDVAVIVNDPTHQGRMVSYFETATDAVFATYAQRGVESRQALIITRAERDAGPLTCSGDTFADGGSLPNWVELD